MNFNDLEKLVQKSRSTRRFEDDYFISLEDLKQLIDLARVSSSAKNMQPLKYILVTKKELVLKLAQTSTWASHLKDWEQSDKERPSAFIIMLNDTSIDGFAMFDAGVSFEAISLGAKTKGLAVCPLASIDKNMCKQIFNIPSNLEILIGVAVGKSAENIKIVDIKNSDINYYRDEEDNHCVPKRKLKEIIISEY